MIDSYYRLFSGGKMYVMALYNLKLMVLEEEALNKFIRLFNIDRHRWKLGSEISCQPSTSGLKDDEINLKSMTEKSKIDTNGIKVFPSLHV